MPAQGCNPGRNGPPLLLWIAMFVAGTIGSFYIVYVDLALSDGFRVPAAGTWLGRDFTNLFVGSRLAAEGVNIYDNAAYLEGLAHHGIAQAQNYSYPPATLLVGTPLSMLPYPAALALWVAAGLIAFVLAARPYVRFHPLWLLFLPALFTRNGQWGVFAAAMFLWSFRGSGVAAGLLTLKPHLGLLLAATMAFKRRWRQTLVALGTCGLLWGGAELMFGLTANFANEGIAFQKLILTYPEYQPYFGAMPSTYVRLRTLDSAWLVHATVAALALAMLWQVREWPMQALAFPAATATFIVLPYGFHYDMAVVSLGFAVLIHQRWNQLGPIEKIIAVLGFLSPTLTGYALAPLVLLAGLHLQTRMPIEDGNVRLEHRPPQPSTAGMATA